MKLKNFFFHICFWHFNYSTAQDNTQRAFFLNFITKNHSQTADFKEKRKKTIEIYCILLFIKIKKEGVASKPRHLSYCVMKHQLRS